MTKPIHWKTAGMIIPGAFLLFTHVLIFRELLATAENELISIVAVLFYFTFWIMLGSFLMSSNKQQDFLKWDFSLIILLTMLPTLSLIGISITMLLPVLMFGSGCTGALAIAGFSTILPGIGTGVLLGMLATSPRKDLSSGNTLFLGLGYLSAGVILYPRLINNEFNPVIFIALTGVIITLGAALANMKSNSSALRKRLTFILIIITLLANSCIMHIVRQSYSSHWAKTLPGWRFIKNIETSSGRMSILSQDNTKSSSRKLLIMSNGKHLWQIPEDCSKYCSGIIPATLQPDKTSIDVLLVCSPFSLAPAMLAGLSYVNQVTMICPDEELAPTAAASGILPSPSSKFQIIFTDPLHILKRSTHKYDLILLLEPFRKNYYGAYEFIELAMPHLTAAGAIVLPSEFLFSEKNNVFLKEQFEKTIKLPGNSGLIALGNDNPTANPEILEKRFERINPQPSLLPRGTFSILYSIPENDIPVNNQLDNFLPLDFNLFNQQNHGLTAAVAILIIAIYGLQRFFMSRKNNFAVLFCSFENGFCTMGFVYLAIMVLKYQESTLYLNAGIITATLGGAAIGSAYTKMGVFRLPVIAAVILLPLSLLYSSTDYMLTLLPWLSCMSCICGGLAGRYLSARRTIASPDGILSCHLLGAVTVIAWFSLLLMLGGNIYLCIGIIIILRVPLILSKLAIR